MNTQTAFSSPPEDEVGQRRQAILAIVQEQGFATIEVLARQFGVSAQTVRRDIVHLDGEGAVRRFHGGAGLPEAHGRLPYAEKRAVAPDAKERIGRAAAALVQDGASVFLDVGTTVEAIARALRGRRALRVFTCSLPAATLLADAADGPELFVLGGLVRGADGSLTGDATTAAIARFRFDWAFVGFSGCEPDGTLMDFDLAKVAVKQVAIARSHAAVAVGTADKFTRTALVAVAGLDAFSCLVTDRAPPAALAEPMAAGAVRLVTA
ncbi:DeoR family transcriptional regulator [Stella humosa]|uniref:DeoR family transcriptional regulator n=1 Tax=Stella humosa TaxID=94 RepID=A0A3N1MB53_9PROT|nr:DeoR/GlpR family DNA-binding transcription regulator [Stella humosa]ROQ00285.1 DeoR family transcriptional regulator [Stella humosa]BBK30477.1 DeoR family transcriptional regulator [Stella humosa]